MAGRLLLLGHRGARKYAPENTMQAFHLALEHGCDGFEFDVRITADERCIVCHDSKHKRLEVAKASLAELRSLCDLEAVLAEFSNRAFLNLEMKVAGAEEVVLETLKKFPPIQGLIVSSFLPEVIVRLHELKAQFALGLICENKRQLARWRELPIQALMLHRGLVKQEFVDAIRKDSLRTKEGLNGTPTIPQIFVWTVNAAREMRKFAEMGVDGIISDDTRRLVETVG